VLNRFFDDRGLFLWNLTRSKPSGSPSSLVRRTQPPVVIDAGALPYLVAFLTSNEYPMLQFEAAWALTNVTSTSRTKDVPIAKTQSVAGQTLVQSEVETSREQAIWCIGNIAGESVAFRDGILREPGLIEGMRVGAMLDQLVLFSIH
jgi:hypothetical protein